MKKLISLVLALAIVFSMAACGCQHEWQEATCKTAKTCALCGETEGEPAEHAPEAWVVTSVDTQALSMAQDLNCAVCGELIATKDSSTGSAPVNSTVCISPDEWFNCLITNIASYGAGQSLYGYPVESADNALLHSIVTMSQMNAVFSFLDAEGNTITTDQRDMRGNVHNIRMDAQFTNDNAKEFFMLLMLVLINNNAELEPGDANTLCGQIMSGEQVTDNGYTYAMEIVSVENHTVCVSITAE